MSAEPHGAGPAGNGMSLAELGAALGGQVEGDPEVRILGAAGLQDATPGSVVRVEHPRYLQAALSGPAAALIVGPELGPVEKPCIRISGVRGAFARCLELFAPREEAPLGVHETAIVGPNVTLGSGCSVMAYAVIGRGARLGDGVVVHPHAVVGEDAELGAGSIIYSHAVLYRRTVTGARVRVHAGAVIGADGYGYEWNGERHQKIPQVGRVRLGDDVEVGANTTIDRATTGETVVGAGTKIDNLVQIGHNVTTGQHCLIVSQVGIAGSVTLGNGVVMGGQSGSADHLTIADGARIAARGGVWGDVPAGAVYGGHPARPQRDEVRIQAAMRRLPELLRRVKELERLLEEK